ncbi:Ribonuclease H2 subunit C [Halotydeus destructor]|nr:Ribonuclease H2 subunit C [Halotydeus destructor]
MSIVIDTKLKKKKESNCHLLPVTIKHNGPAKVSSYFTNIIQTKDTTSTASFRGKPLIGSSVDLPENYTGLVLKKTDNSLAATSSFNKFTYWKWDQIPNSSDAVKQSVQWLDIAAAIHTDPEKSN